MKNMTKSLVMASSILLLGASAYAKEAPPGEFTHQARTSVINTMTVGTKDEAYALGLKQLKALQAKSSRELDEALDLNLRTFKEKDSVALENGYITVQELMNDQGKIVYKGQVNVTYHYSTQRND